MSQEQYFRNLAKNLFIQIQIMQNLGLTYGGENGGGKEYGLYVVPADCKVLKKICTLPKLHMYKQQLINHLLWVFDM